MTPPLREVWARARGQTSGMNELRWPFFISPMGSFNRGMQIKKIGVRKSLWIEVRVLGFVCPCATRYADFIGRHGTPHLKCYKCSSPYIWWSSAVVSQDRVSSQRKETRDKGSTINAPSPPALLTLISRDFARAHVREIVKYEREQGPDIRNEWIKCSPPHKRPHKIDSIICFTSP